MGILGVFAAWVGAGSAASGLAMLKDKGDWLDKAGAAGLLCIAGICGYTVKKYV